MLEIVDEAGLEINKEYQSRDVVGNYKVRISVYRRRRIRGLIEIRFELLSELSLTIM